MKFLTLMQKEIREILPWILLAAISFLAIGLFIITMLGRHTNFFWQFSNIKPGTEVEIHRLITFSVLTMNGVWLFTVSLALGLILGIRQFWIAFFTKTWAFEFHRSVKRQTVLYAKLSAAIIAFLLALGAVWTFFYIYSSRSGVLINRPSFRNFLEGWIFIALSFLAYLATALTALAGTRWYTTKIFGLAFASLIVFRTVSQSNPGWALITLIIGAVILLSQVTYTFLNREF